MEEPKAKERILEAATALFGNRGFNGVSTGDIAKAADINKAMIFYYFGSKENLYRAVFTSAALSMNSQLSTSIENAEPGMPTIEAIVRTHIGYLKKHPVLVKLVIRELLSSKESVSSVLEDNFLVLKKIRANLTDAITQARELNQIRDVDTNHTIINIMSLDIFFFLGQPIFSLFMPESDIPSFELNRVDHVVDLILNGLQKKRSINHE